jgi:thiamine monophosphate synthase
VKNNKLDYYIFIEELNEKIIKNIIHLKKRFKINIIIFPKDFYLISKFVRTNRIPFYVIDNLQFAVKNRAQGLFLSGKNKKISRSIKETTKLDVIGSAHNQLEYSFKEQQKCKTIMLSPIFYNDKYSLNKILFPIKFNLISLNWNINICALGGISKKNIKLINITKSNSIGVKSLIKN